VSRKVRVQAGSFFDCAEWILETPMGSFLQESAYNFCNLELDSSV